MNNDCETSIIWQCDEPLHRSTGSKRCTAIVMSIPSACYRGQHLLRATAAWATCAVLQAAACTSMHHLELQKPDHNAPHRDACQPNRSSHAAVSAHAKRQAASRVTEAGQRWSISPFTRACMLCGALTAHMSSFEKSPHVAVVTAESGYMSCLDRLLLLAVAYVSDLSVCVLQPPLSVEAARIRVTTIEQALAPLR
jgi:hypothetical protein